jgi:hypothetical protein
MGYPVLSAEKFRIQYKNSNGDNTWKRINVFAKDDETAIIVDCKARETRGRRALQKEIEEIEQTQRKISQAVRSHFGDGFNPKIIWLFATANIIWAEKDVERAEHANLRIVTENELQYFEAFVSHIGTAGRYQFLAEFLEGQQIPHLENVRIPAVRGRFGAHVYVPPHTIAMQRFGGCYRIGFVGIVVLFARLSRLCVFGEQFSYRFFHPPRCPGAPPLERGVGPNSGPDWRESVGWKILLPLPASSSEGLRGRARSGR